MHREEVPVPRPRLPPRLLEAFGERVVHDGRSRLVQRRRGVQNVQDELRAGPLGREQRLLSFCLSQRKPDGSGTGSRRFTHQVVLQAQRLADGMTDWPTERIHKATVERARTVSNSRSCSSISGAVGSSMAAPGSWYFSLSSDCVRRARPFSMPPLDPAQPTHRAARRGPAAATERSARRAAGSVSRAKLLAACQPSQRRGCARRERHGVAMRQRTSQSPPRAAASGRGARALRELSARH